ncbi:MAG: class I SAM-dependent methyltransferase [Anaerolineae bacterium]|nr:class I SAM-dependent methyltransferase [Anaerolineae bacterium]
MTDKCRICGATGHTPLWTVSGFDWVKCLSCGSLQTTKIYTQNELGRYYASDYYEGYTGRQDQGAYIDYIGQKAFIQGNLARRVRWILGQTEIPREADWLDVGCAAGFLLEVVREYGCRPWGIDYSDYGPRYARTSLAISGARQGVIEALPSDFPRHCDVISAIDVIEHVTDQHSMLTHCVQHLKAGGYLVGETFDPASLFARLTGPRWHAIDPPNHFAILSLRGIDTILRSHGLTKVGAIRLPRRLSLPAITTKFGVIGRNLSVGLYSSRLASVGVPVWLGDVVLWIYRKEIDNHRAT